MTADSTVAVVYYLPIFWEFFGSSP